MLSGRIGCMTRFAEKLGRYEDLQNVRLTISAILTAQSDKALLDKLSAELTRQLSSELHDDLDALVSALEGLSPGLRAMAVTYQLDVSMALDDLGWHFANWHHRLYCDETSRGLRELGANEVAELYDSAYQAVLPYWDAIGDMLAVEFKIFSDWYHGSELEKSLSPLNNRLWDICEQSKEFRLLKFWLDYARKFPERVVEQDSHSR